MTVNYCLRRAKSFFGRNLAIHFEDRETTYEQFYRLVEDSARKLANLGAGKGDRVALLMLNSPEYLELYYSTAMAGAVIVPLNTRWHVNEIIYTLTDSGSKILFLDDRFASLAPQIRNAVPSLEHFIYVGSCTCPTDLLDWKTVAFHQATKSFPEPNENDLFGLFYTSGTTGGPKGAMLTHRNIYSNAVHSLLPPDRLLIDGKWLHAAPMFHLADCGAIPALTLCGTTHCFLSSFDPEATLRAIEHYRITSLVLVPAMINMVVNHPNFNDYDLSSLKRIMYGASPMPLPLLKQSMEKFPCDFTQGYGMTEVSPVLTMLAPHDHCFDNTERRFAPVKSAGKPVTGVEVRVVDLNDDDVPVGQVGEVIARGPNVMKGYWNRPEVNAEVLRGGWMHTGDLGALDEEGFLYILDRKKDMIKTGSENVYSPEVESTICAHPGVLEAAVIGVPHETWGETIRAIAVTRPGCSLTEAELIAWCRERLTHFKCPTSVVFTDSLPKGGTGKVQKNVLRERFCRPEGGRQKAAD
jgi:long-chain acyl-CoA synthetase